MTGTQAERRYGVEIESGKQLRALQRMEEAYGMQVAEWAQEGMPIEAMGTPSQMEAFRERKGTPVPWNVEEHNEQSVQRSADAAADASPAGDAGVPESVRDVISSPGQSLDVSIQRTIERRMGDSFGDVRVHAGPTAARASEEIDARAFTVGNHVAFNSGEYDPSSPEGQHVLAHELAHVRQQTGGAVSMLPKEDVELEIDPDPALEREAEVTAQRVVKGGDLGVQTLADTEVHVQRLNDQRPTDEPMEEWAAGFDFEELAGKYLQENTDVIAVDPEEAERQINPKAGDQLTRGLRREVDPLPERDPAADSEDVKRNVAIAKIEINESSFWVAAASSPRNFNEEDEDNPLIPGPSKPEREIDHRNYDDEHMDNGRMWCTEPKILEHVINEFDEDADGEILLYTEQDPCEDACRAFIQEFREYFSTGDGSGNLDLNISYTFEVNQ